MIVLFFIPIADITTVKVLPQFEEIFKKSEATVVEYFKNKSQDPTKGTIMIAGERYILVRAASMSVEFFGIIENLFIDKGDEFAHSIVLGMLFNIAHALGRAGAEDFTKKMNLKSPVEKLSAGPIHFAHMGWAFVDILPESKPSPDENYFLIYDHPYSFESDAWLKNSAATADTICIMNSGYSSGWCEVSFGIPLVAVEIECKAAGDKHDRFIMAQPSKIKTYIERYKKTGGKVSRKHINYETPGFFREKLQAEELRIKNAELEMVNKSMVGRELKMIELKKEIEELKKRLRNTQK